MIISRILFLLLSASCLFFGQPVLAANISKCQDADGKWHYGDFAADACAQSKVEKINQKGQKIGEQKAPIPEEERQKRALEKKLAAEKKAAEKIQRIKDKRLLSVYESPEAIEKAREDRKSVV